MSARGKGNVTIRRGTMMPNLALAGKREETSASTPKDSDRSKKTRGQSNRGRGRGGGRGGGFSKPALIQSEGIFSEGLSGEAAKKAKREAEPSITFAKNSRNGPEKKEDKVDTEASKASFAGWDAEWQSDEEDDKELLQNLTGSFVTDVKRGDRPPIVLPQQDEAQFDKVTNTQSKMEVDEEEFIDEDYKTDGKHEAPFAHLSRKAGHILGQVLDNPDDSLIFLQLPGVVNVLTGSRDEVEPMQVDEQIKVDAPKPYSLPDLPRGNKVGKLQVLRSGRVVLRVGDVVMDVTSSAPTELRENVVLVETSNQESNSGGLLSPREGQNAVYHMGSVKHHLMASLDWKDVQRANTAKDADSSSSKKAPSQKNRSVADRALLDELRALDQEASTWSTQAEAWASP